MVNIATARTVRAAFSHAPLKVKAWAAYSVILFALITGATSPAAADDLQDCQQDKDLKLKVQGCSRLLNLSLPPADQAEVRLLRGWAYARLSQHSNAISDLTESIRIDSTNAYAYVVRGGAYQTQQRYDLAIADYDTAIQLKPDFVEVYQDRGVCRLAKGDTEGAIADFGLVIQKKPESPGAYYMRARGKLLLKQNDGAIADLTYLMNLHPDWKAAALFYRALAYEAKGRADLAKSDFANAIAIDSTLELERRWVEYLKSIQADGDYANWSGKPYDLYLRISGF